MTDSLTAVFVLLPTYMVHLLMSRTEYNQIFYSC